MRILDYIERFARSIPEAPVIITPQRADLSYKCLLEFAKETRTYLAGLGLRGENRIASAISGRPESVSLFFAVTDLAVFVPLNPDYSEDEFLTYFKILKIDAVVVEEGQLSAAPQAAAKAGVLVIRLTPRLDQAGGIFGLACDRPSIAPPEVTIPSREEHDIAMILHTSGTTSLPKIVPRTHINICVSAEFRNRAFGLTGNDRILILFPIYRGNTYNTVLSSVSLGGSLICAGGFEPLRFFGLLEETASTWFAAGPAVLQTIADYAEAHGIVSESTTLRFIRSTGASLSVQLKERLDNIFHVPVYASYGMTEVGNITSTYLGGKGIKPGSVGATAGCVINILDETGTQIQAGVEGEIALRGPNVFPGYEDNPELNASVFVDGWFKTGDLGRMDEDGYLFITGRVKELINRGGEKISPYEVEQAIFQHPGIMDAVVFPLSDSDFNETVAAMIVLKPGWTITLKELRRFLQGKIKHFKMPTRLFFADKIPSGKAGKIQRNTLFQHLEGLKEAEADPENGSDMMGPAQNDTEKKLVSIWKNILHLKKVGMEDDLFELGGDSLTVACLYSEIERIWGRKIPLTAIYRMGTIRRLAELIDEGERGRGCSPSLVPIRDGGGKTPLFCIHAVDGEATAYRKLAEYLGQERPVYGFRFDLRCFKRHETVVLRNLAAAYIRDIRKIQTVGPYFIVGYSFGGKLAVETARQMREAGLKIGLLVLLDAIQTHVSTKKKAPGFRRERRRKMSRKERMNYTLNKLAKELRRIGLQFPMMLFERAPKRLRRLIGGFISKGIVLKVISREFKNGPYSGDVTFVQPAEATVESHLSVSRWTELAEGFRLITVPGEHATMIQEPYVISLAKALETLLEQAEVKPNYN